jgi:hypothetical protein
MNEGLFKDEKSSYKNIKHLFELLFAYAGKKSQPCGTSILLNG